MVQHQSSDHIDSDSCASVFDPFNADIQPGDVDDLWEESTIHLKSLQVKITADFIKDISNAKLDDLSLGLSDKATDRL